jgi:hypothetical protein
MYSIFSIHCSAYSNIEASIITHMESQNFFESKEDFIKDLGRFLKCRVPEILTSSGM